MTVCYKHLEELGRLVIAAQDLHSILIFFQPYTVCFIESINQSTFS